VRIEAVSRPGDVELDAVRTLLVAATAADGTPPLSDQVHLRLTHDGDAATHLLVWDNGQLVAYAQIDDSDASAGPSAELVVHPGHRGRGVGSRLLDELLSRSGGGRLHLWAHGTHPGAERLAHRLGFERSRLLWQLRRPLTTPLPDAPLPAGVSMRTFEIGRDELRWLELNNRAFAAHPEQGRWTLRDIEQREAEPWFDPAGFFLAERAGALVAFHWTKVHGALGEVYVLGVDPDAAGTGLGAAMTVIGLEHLRARGLPEAMLYVDDDNSAALRLYERLGFERYSSDVSFVLAPRQ
jgi:mycothiol synthase